MSKTMPMRWQTGFDTDMGGGKENQDDCFVWSSIEKGICVLCILDGHGREVGKSAAKAAKRSLQEFFQEHHSELKVSPYNCLIRAHEEAHLAIKTQFKCDLEQDGYDVMESHEGYLLKSKRGQKQWLCIHGGSTCSVCALVDGNLFIANVGDSSAILCSTQQDLCKADVTMVGDAAVHNELSKQYTNSIHVDDSNSKNKSATIVITADHSPESPYEFLRLRDFRSSEESREQPSLNIVYDSPTYEKAKCPPVFSLSENGLPILNNKGW